MKKNMLLIFISLIGGVLFTFLFLNKENIYAKEEYVAYAFQVGAYENLENAENFCKTIDSSIIIKEDNLYKVYLTIYKDMDVVNKMVSFYENNHLNIYLKMLHINKNFYQELDNYEKLLVNSQESVYSKINQSILDLYLESMNYEKNI